MPPGDTNFTAHLVTFLSPTSRVYRDGQTENFVRNLDDKPHNADNLVSWPSNDQIPPLPVGTMFQPNSQDHLHLRLHRARSVVLTTAELVEVRAAQRTFEGAYMRTALGQFSFALIILKIFTAEFYPIGALFAVYGATVMLVATYRRYQGHRQFFDGLGPDPGPGPTPTPAVAGKFRTSGNTVATLTLLSIGAYVTLLGLTWRLGRGEDE